MRWGVQQQLLKAIDVDGDINEVVKHEMSLINNQLQHAPFIHFFSFNSAYLDV